MPKIKLLVLTAFAIFALSVPATALAKEGGEWLVNGTRLANGAILELLPTALVLAPGELKITGVGSIQCTAHEIQIEGGKITGPDGILAKKLTFNKCSLAESEVCSLENESISTVPIHGLASLDLPGSLNAYILLLPETKNVLTTFKFTGASCALLGTQAITGDFSLLIPGALHEVLLHLVSAFSLPKALKIGASEASLLGLEFDIALFH
jgi:hypothetical protein